MALPADRTFIAQEQDTTNLGRTVFMCLRKTSFNHIQYVMCVQNTHDIDTLLHISALRCYLRGVIATR
jgi:hypothetical protein